MTPPLRWRLFNALRRYVEDRHAGEANYVAQMRTLRERSQKRQAEHINLLVFRGERRSVLAQTTLRRVS